MVSKKSTLSVIQKFSWGIGGFAENISNNVFITENTEYCSLENVPKNEPMDKLYKGINQNLGYQIKKKDAEVLHHVINCYKKGK